MDAEKFKELMEAIRAGNVHLAAVIAQSLGMPSEEVFRGHGVYGAFRRNTPGPDLRTARPFRSYDPAPSELVDTIDLGDGQALIMPPDHKPPTPIKDYAYQKKRERRLR